jgi:Zn-finger nucleic acid-binding protein
MHCPVCEPRQSLDPVHLEGGQLAARECAHCGGNWIRTADYWKWRAMHGENRPVTAPPPEPVPVHDAPGLKRCPDCDYVLARYRIGHDVPFTVDRCRNCDGVWLDRDEWRQLVARNLHDDLPMIFDDAWQRSVRRDENRRTTEESFRRRLGAGDYARAREMRAWLDAHPKRSELLAYLHLHDRV